MKLTLNENQLKIIEALLQKEGEASQTQILYLTGVPKSSLSRNLEILAQKQVISKFYNGTSNYIKIHPSLYK
ncbi:MAG: helix-turn-helix transcriptional regulator [Nanoarchaeota archaeon]